MKKPPSKVAQNSSNPLFSLTALTAQKAQTEEFMFKNVAYRPTVYKTGEITSWSGDGARKALLFHNVCDPVFLANREMQSRFGTL